MFCEQEIDYVVIKKGIFPTFVWLVGEFVYIWKGTAVYGWWVFLVPFWVAWITVQVENHGCWDKFFRYHGIDFMACNVMVLLKVLVHETHIGWAKIVVKWNWRRMMMDTKNGHLRRRGVGIISLRRHSEWLMSIWVVRTHHQSGQDINEVRVMLQAWDAKGATVFKIWSFSFRRLGGGVRTHNLTMDGLILILRSW